MSRSVTIEWPIAAWPNPNRDRRKHWARVGTEARKIREHAAALARRELRNGPPLNSPIEVLMLMHFPDARERDLDNWSSKALIDGICDSGLIAGDSHKHIVKITRVYEPARSKKGHIRIEARIYEVSGTPVDGPDDVSPTWENENGPRGAGNTAEGLTNDDLSRRP